MKEDESLYFAKFFPLTFSRLWLILPAIILLGAFSACAQERTPTPLATPSAAVGQAAAKGVLHVHIVGLRNSKGRVGCTLFNRPSAFPKDGSKALRDMEVPIRNKAAWCNFRGISPGTYAMVVFHDENDNGRFDRDALGMPLEGYAFSNNALATFGPPTFRQASFRYKGGVQWLTITMTYPR